MEGVTRSLGASLFIASIAISSHNHPLGLVSGCLVVIAAAASYLTRASGESLSGSLPEDGTEEEGHHSTKASHIHEQARRSIGALTFSAILIYLALAFPGHFIRRITSSTPSHPSFSSLSSLLLSHQAECRRPPLPLPDSRSNTRTYHEFDDVLLIVFFSHARYNGNLDSYREVYGEWFPNIIFIGPASREDKGFAHSYDVLVDSYQSDENLTDHKNYKMAGRMAHHMLYTALSAHPCYKGYLWAPFDTLLNIPRLQQFDQDLFWYHSPWAQYVYNPALGDEEENGNKTRHPPPLNVSPDPEVDWTETWRGWGPDWWCGDPHVGLGVCMKAFRKVPIYMRERMANGYTNGETRLVGGSADTIYIPGRYRDEFLDVLGLFLETDCFLEIATPTAVHLVAPPTEPILFVDHWWIWYPPFNAAFVRQKWTEGFEVDTMHTFHWGEKGDDGVWVTHPENIRDVRAMQKESALRQKVKLG
ncbi:hypothetical protein JAAARDRAFT_30310 [Jaapia argillacea MUCL 33604]|uniref:Uncharacterized protein n=1 Tax=Jaapia argillacea MUCL 33604 TaxID=933084 RepID=A0A067QFW1_9AGAM|nr:hypothetical protein JAAARDRAFT_30310 [Jaapia argillacea MUCL 33604]